MKRFEAEQLDRAADLAREVDERAWIANKLPESERQLLCEYWAFNARALLDETLSEPDRMACLWVLHVVKGIARTAQIFVFGLKRDHQDDWAARARRTGARLHAREKRKAAQPAPIPKPKVAEVRSAALAAQPSLPKLDGKIILLVGGEPDNVLLERLAGSEFTLEWIPSNVRQVQAATDRIRLGKVGGVVFLTDLNRHASFYMIRDACSLSSTPVVFGTKGLAATRRALEDLNERAGDQRHSA